MKKIPCKLVSLLLAIIMLLSIAVPASAASISDGKSTTVTIKMGNRNTYLSLSNGNSLGGEGWTYTTNDGIQGPGYCVNWGLKAPSSTKQLQISGRYTSSPKTSGAFANGYPQFPLSDFLELHSASPEIKGLTGVKRIHYRVHVCVWARTVPAGFHQVEAPHVYCNVLSGLPHEYRFTNKTDVGGLWGNQWIMAGDRWVTVVWNNVVPPKLPRTGY